MPIYEAVCLKCGAYHEYFRRMDDCLNTPDCCGVKTEKRILTGASLSPDIQPWDAYESPASGKWITTKAERKADMKATGSRDWEGREVEEKMAKQAKDYAEAEQDKKLDEVVRTAWGQLSPAKKALALKEAA